MPFYRFHRLAVSSSVELPELVEIRARGDDLCHVRFEVTAASEMHLPPDSEGIDVEHVTADAEHGTIVSFGAGVEFFIPLSADQIVAHHLVDADIATMRHLLLDHALPRLLATRGHFTAHGSGVDYKGSALIFLGPSGNGKSSMAAGLHRAGHRLLGDDCFTLTPNDDDTVSAMSTYRSLRLLPESIDEFYANVPAAEFSSMGTGYKKVRIIEEGMREPRSLPVAGIFVLIDPDHVGPPLAELLSSRDAVVELTKNSFRLDATGAVSLGSALDQAEAIARCVPVVALHFERSFDNLEAIHQVIFDSVGMSR